MKSITIKAGDVLLEAELNNSMTARAVAGALPVEATGSRWGGEIYFEIPVRAELEPCSRDVLEAGELGYWPSGRAFCIFFGSTPVSEGGEIRAASAVNVIGRIVGDTSALWDVPDGSRVVIEAGQDG